VAAMLTSIIQFTILAVKASGECDLPDQSLRHRHCSRLWIVDPSITNLSMAELNAGYEIPLIQELLDYSS
jgi:hypothetical protein